MLKHESNHIYIYNPYKPIYPHIWNTTNQHPHELYNLSHRLSLGLGQVEMRGEALKVYDLKRRLGLPGRRLRAYCNVPRFFFFRGGLFFGRWFRRYLEQWMLKQHAETTWKTWQEHMICGRKAESKRGIVVGDGFFRTVPSLLLFNYI